MKDNYQLFINGQLQAGSSHESLDVISPIDEAFLARVPKGNRQDAVLALESSEKARAGWARLPAQTRAHYINALADELAKETQKLARIITLEQGKTIREARGEVAGAVNFLRYAAQSARRIEGEIITSEIQAEQIWIQRVPFGVTVGILAWNFPLALACRKIGNALVCGNTMVVKPPTETPLAVLELAELINRAGIPAGVLNIITGAGSVVGDELVRNPITRLVTLTGSTEAGRQLYQAAADNITVLRLELGGKAPFIVLDDADIDKAVQAAVNSRFCNCGQVCTCNERMYLHEKIYTEFMEKFIARTKEITVGNPLLEETDMGPKVNQQEIDKLINLVSVSKQQGAAIALGGQQLKEGQFKKGFWFEPTIITDCTNDMDIIRQEIFGPIVPVVKVSSFEQALLYANDCQFGLSAYLFTQDMKKIMRAVNELEFGEVYVNRQNGELVNAFHNGFKKSGVGGEDGKHGLEGYLEKKTIYLNYQ